MQPFTKQISKQSAHNVTIKAYSILLISSILYAGNVIAGKLIANDVPSAGLSAIRGMLGLLIIVPLAWPRLRTSTRPNRNELLQLMALGFFGITLAYLTFIIGIKYSSGTNASIISATSPALTNILLVIVIGSGRATIFNNLQPVFSIILSVFILGESLAIYHWIGFLLVISGIVLSLAKKGQSSEEHCPTPIAAVPAARK